MVSTEVYNLIALAGLLLGKAGLLLLIVYYCCKRKPDMPAARQQQDSGNQTDPDLEKGDIPPTYSTLVLKVDPPDYLDSVMNEEINPELNKDWAEHMEKGAVSPEVKEVIARSRQNSCCQQHREGEDDRPRRASLSPVSSAATAASARAMRRASAADAHAGQRQGQNLPAIGAFWIGV